MPSSLEDFLLSAAPQREPSEQEPSFWNRLSEGFKGIPSEAWMALGSSLLKNSWVDPVRGTGGWASGLGEGLPMFQEAIKKQKKQKAFDDWLLRRGTYAPIDPELMGVLDPEDAAAVMIKSQLSQERQPPMIKEVQEGNDVVTYAIDPSSNQMVELGRGPKWNPKGEDGLGTKYQQSDPYKLPDGRVVGTRFNPLTGQREYQAENGWSALPSDARPTTASTGGFLTPQQFMKARQELTTEQQSLGRLMQYFTTIGGTDIGIKRWANSVSANAKTLFGSGNLNSQEFAQKSAEAQLQGLLGMFRTEVVGPGVMTEYDAQRVLQALGGNIDALQNPQVVEDVLRRLYDTKQQRVQTLYEDVARSANVFGVTMEPYQAQPFPGSTPKGDWSIREVQ